MTKLPITLAATLVSLTACQFMMPGGARMGAGGGGMSAENPLTSGQPLEATIHGADVGGVSEADCNTWPFEDKVTVQVTAAQICVDVIKNHYAPTGWSGEPTAESSEGVQVANEAGAGPYINARKARSSKVGQCFNRGFNGNTPIWAFEYKGCEPNGGTVTATTASLSVEHQMWSFPIAAPAAPAGAPPSATPATAAN